MKRISLIFMAAATIAATLALSSCSREQSEWNDSQSWYTPAHEYDAGKLDVLYLVSTEVISATDEQGRECWQSRLTEADLSAINGEIAWVENNMFNDGFNLISPYYHQLTFNALTRLDSADREPVWQNAVKEACDAFDWYMEHQNGGRPFVIAGFSQGAMLALELLRHMSDGEYSRMVACYMLGYRLSAKDLEHPHVKAATGEGDTGVTISFNSTQSREAIWPLVAADAATCINPLNWKTDSTPATFEFSGTTNTVHVDPETNVLLVDTDDPDYYYSFYELAPFFLDAGVNRDNLHHWDLLFYPRQIHDNALLRSRNKR